MNETELIIANLMPHPLSISNTSPFAAQVIQGMHYIAQPDHVVVSGLPSPLPGRLYIVTRDIFDARPNRTDLLTPAGDADVIATTSRLLGRGQKGEADG